jgi:hypothetical protein
MSTAAVSLQPNSPHLRIYSSDGATVTEKCWEGGWSTGAFKQPGQYVSAVSWYDGNVHIRVYVTNAGVTSEWCWDNAGPWYKGAYPG